MRQRAVILLSGGLDSATVLALARAAGTEAHALSIFYGQRSAAELGAARRIATTLGAVGHRIIDLPALGEHGGSALTDSTAEIPAAGGEGVPSTYVPARNTVFLSLALAWAEVIDASEIHIGVNDIDCAGYPDCRQPFITAFEAAANLGTRAGTEGTPFAIRAPLMAMTKADIIRTGHGLGVDYSMTVSCYDADADGRACGVCDACVLRAGGFRAAGLVDPTRYRPAR